MALNRFEPIDISDISSIEDWLERFYAYVLTNDKINDKNKTAFYTTMIGKDAYNYKLLKTLAYPETVAKLEVKKLRSLLESHLTP